MKTIISLLIAMLLPAAVFCATPADGPTPLPHFAWGADIGGAIDLSGHDLSTINIDAYFGYRNTLFPILGLGAGINMPVSNSRREFPVYAIARTSFSRQPQPVFIDLRAGIVLNTHPDLDSQTDLFLSPGIGFRLATGRLFSSYIILGYIYNGLHSHEATSADDLANEIKGIHAAAIRLGITF
ncbi:MAG: hypothetical protein NC342_07975 [Pseudoflavonifractor sp.]|nr:hypothetical protein [Alloprevotella sp.]MCM1117458.1 hypothetical protein [Pseudoflavonifractor sp.]